MFKDCCNAYKSFIEKREAKKQSELKSAVNEIEAAALRSAKEGFHSVTVDNKVNIYFSTQDLIDNLQELKYTVQEKNDQITISGWAV